MEAYLQRYERFALSQKWVEDKRAIILNAFLKGKTLDVYSRIPPE